jgi:hypothetical protein
MPFPSAEKFTVIRNRDMMHVTLTSILVNNCSPEKKNKTNILTVIIRFIDVGFMILTCEITDSTKKKKNMSVCKLSAGASDTT